MFWISSEVAPFEIRITRQKMHRFIYGGRLLHEATDSEKPKKQDKGASTNGNGNPRIQFHPADKGLCRLARLSPCFLRFPWLTLATHTADTCNRKNFSESSPFSQTCRNTLENNSQGRLRSTSRILALYSNARVKTRPTVRVIIAIHHCRPPDKPRCCPIAFVARGLHRQSSAPEKQNEETVDSDRIGLGKTLKPTNALIHPRRSRRTQTGVFQERP